MIRGFWVLLWLLVSTSTGLAHSTSRSTSIWVEEQNTVRMIYSIQRLQATLLVPLQSDPGSLEALLAGHLLAALQVRQGADATKCLPSLPKYTPSNSQQVQVEIVFTCPNEIQTRSWSLQNNALFDFASTHIHIAMIENETLGLEVIFTHANRQHTMVYAPNTNAKTPRVWANFLTYMRLGIDHILNGFDHLIFVTALVILAKKTRHLLLLITGFTLGHSLTLALAAMQIITPFEIAIEALIGFSIAFIAMEILIPPGSRDWRMVTNFAASFMIIFAVASWLGVGKLPPSIWIGLGVFIGCYGALIQSTNTAKRASIILTSVFGLVHGAGFASVLIETGLPAQRQFSALAGFNIGVEIGQVLVVLGWVLLLKLVRLRFAPKQIQQVEIAMASMIMAAGLFWFVERSFG